MALKDRQAEVPNKFADCATFGTHGVPDDITLIEWSV